jgi:hypothetical protein
MGQLPSAPNARTQVRDYAENKLERVSSMRTFTLAVTLFALVIQSGIAFAQQKQKEATIVSGMTVEIDSNGKAVIITPRSESGVLEPLAITISDAKHLVDALVVMITQAEAAEQPNKP